MQESKLSKEIYQDLYDRNSRGLNKYGHLLDDNNYQDMLQHAYEEALALTQYLKKEINVKYVAFDIYKNLVLVDFVERNNRVLYLKNDKIITLIKKAGYEVSSIKRLHNKKPNRYNKP